MDLPLFNRSKMAHKISMGRHQMFLLSLSIDSNLLGGNEKMSGKSTKVVMVVGKRFNNPFLFLLFKTTIVPAGTKTYQQPCPNVCFNFTGRLLKFDFGDPEQS